MWIVALRERNLNAVALEGVPDVRQDLPFDDPRKRVVLDPERQAILDAGVLVGRHESLGRRVVEDTPDRFRRLDQHALRLQRRRLCSCVTNTVRACLVVGLL